RAMSRNLLATAALVVLALTVTLALAAPWLPLADPDAVNTPARLRPPLAPGAPLGTDERSEERRVGKECALLCRSRRSPCQYTKNILPPHGSTRLRGRRCRGSFAERW